MFERSDWVMRFLLATASIGLWPGSEGVSPSNDKQPTGNSSAPRDAGAPLPRALLQIGTNDLRTRDFIMALAFSPDGRQIAALAANEPFPTLALFDVATGKPARRLEIPDAANSRVSCMAFAPDGTKLLWGESSGSLALWDLTDGTLLFREELHSAEVKDVVFAPEDRSPPAKPRQAGTTPLGLVATSSASGEVHLRQIANPAEPLRQIQIGPKPEAGKAAEMAANDDALKLAFTPDGAQVIIGLSKDAQILAWDLAEGNFQRSVESAHGEGGRSFNPLLNGIAVTPHGSRIMSVGQRTVPRSRQRPRSHLRLGNGRRETRPRCRRKPGALARFLAGR